MMNVTQLVFSWPREAQYSCKPDEYAGWAIEDYDFEISNNLLEVGDARTWEGRQWVVSQVEEYESVEGFEGAFYIAVFSLDGAAVERSAWALPSLKTMYVCLTLDDALFGVPEHPEVIPEMGDEVKDMPGWIVSAVREFIPSDNGTFDRILVCWCSPVEAAGKQLPAGAIA